MNSEPAGAAGPKRAGEVESSSCRVLQPGRPSMTALAFGTVLPWLLIGVGTWLGFQLVRQNGRLLLRLETIEKQLAPRAGAKAREAGGLPVGMAAPDFELPDLTGIRHKLSDFRDSNV